MKTVKIAFFDLDGTLIRMGNQPMTERMTQTLQQLQAQGIKICIATGRPIFSLPEFAKVEFDAYLTFNASYCCTKEEVIYNHPILTCDVEKIVQNAKSMNRSVTLASKNCLGANGTDQNIEDYFAISKETAEIMEDFENFEKEEIYQIMIGCLPEEYDTIMKDVTGAKITAWWPRAVDVIPSNGGKGLGVQKVLDYFHLSKEEAVAFGDGTNDIEMLEAVGLGVAMGNATDNVKAIADDVCDTVDNDGIYQYCKNKNWI